MKIHPHLSLIGLCLVIPCGSLDSAYAKESVGSAVSLTDADAVDAAQRPDDHWQSQAMQKKTASDVSKSLRIEDIVEPSSDYRYAAFGKSDPFVPPMVTEQDVPVDPLEIPIVSPLQRFQLDELSLVGIWQLSSGERKAMVMTPANTSAGGQGIIVKVGDPIGLRGGRILTIGDELLTVREFTLTPDGVRQFEDHPMHMSNRRPEDLVSKLRFMPGKLQPEIIGDQLPTVPAAPLSAVAAPVGVGATATGTPLSALPNTQLNTQSNALPTAAASSSVPMAPAGPAASLAVPSTLVPSTSAVPTSAVPAVAAPAAVAPGGNTNQAPATNLNGLTPNLGKSFGKY